MKLWLKEQTYAENSLLLIENYSRGKLTPDQLPDADLPIWIAAQRAVSRYEGSLPETMLKSYIETKQSEGYVRLDSE